MSEPIKTQSRAGNFRRDLLTNVSVLALLGYLGASTCAQASVDEDRPVVWIQLGGQIESVSGAPEFFSPPFFNKASSTDLAVLDGAQRQPLFSDGLDGKITFQPESSDWIFSAAIRYGRSSSTRNLHHQTAGMPTIQNTFQGKYINLTPNRVVFADAVSESRESHTVLDFQAGKDFGLGLLGTQGESVINAGVRFAQFTTKNDATLHARPFYTIGAEAGHPGKYMTPSKFVRGTYSGIVRTARSTHAVGPALSWDASLPVAGNSSEMTLNFDWGLNAAVLFGRQRASVHHQTTGYYFHQYGGIAQLKHTSSYANGPPDHNRTRTVTIPNVGGMAALSLKLPNAKVSLGYRADFFFGAMDGGIDTAHRENVGFFGPFASVSVGLGG